MSGLRPVHYKDFEKFLLYVGCVFKRQKGSHRIYIRHDLKRPLVVPAHSNLSIMVIRSNLQTLKIPVEKYLEIMSQI